MALSDKLKDLRLGAGMKQKELADQLHVSQQAIAKWENGKSEPSISMLKEIASFFKCEVDFLIDSEKHNNFDIKIIEMIRDFHSPAMINFENMCSELDEVSLDRIHVILDSIRRIQNNSSLLVNDKQYVFACLAEIIGRVELYIDNYRSLKNNLASVDLAKHNKRFIYSEVEILKSIVNTVNPQEKTVYERGFVLPLYETPVSAGLGSYLGDDTPVEWVSVPQNELTRNADYILEVRGDSMQPTFFDGDKVLVKQSASIIEGEIGVFILNSESYIKKMGRGELISLNPDYKPIKLNEYDDVRCAGKVIDTVILE